MVDRRTPVQVEGPGIYIQEVSGGSRPIVAVGTSTAGFVGTAPRSRAEAKSPPFQAELINNWSQFKSRFFPETIEKTRTGNGTAAAGNGHGASATGGEETSSSEEENGGTQGGGGESSPGEGGGGPGPLATETARVEPAPAAAPDTGTWTYLAHAVYGFFLNGGRQCWVVDIGSDPTDANLKAGLEALGRVDEVAIVAAPGLTGKDQHTTIKDHVDKVGDRVAILDPPRALAVGTSASAVNQWVHPPENEAPDDDKQALVKSENGQVSMYFPWIEVSDPEPERDPITGLTKAGQTVIIPPSGHIAGIWARSDGNRGVHKAPANEPIRGALGLTYHLSSGEMGTLNRAGINALRYFRDGGYMVWGARTLTADPEWRYLNVRRLFNMVKESIAESTRWIVFEPNDEQLWSAIRRDVGAFLTGLWRQGALMGATPQEAFFVKCDQENNPPESIREGKVIIDIGIAPVLPAEFVIFRIGQYEAGTDVEIA